MAMANTTPATPTNMSSSNTVQLLGVGVLHRRRRSTRANVGPTGPVAGDVAAAMSPLVGPASIAVTVEPMHVEMYPDPTSAAQRVAELVIDVVTASPSAVVVLPTGATPVPLYAALAARAAAKGAERVTFAGVRLALLDEYLEVGPDDPRSYRATIAHSVATPLGIPHAAMLAPDAQAPDPGAACAAYDAALAAVGVDVAVLGIGRNGHVAFNEPGTPWNLGTHVTALTATTRADNAPFFAPDPVPTHAITQGPATVLAAKALVLLATGAHKAAALAAAVNGPMSVDCPASLIQRHPHAVVVADAAAAAAL